MKKPFLKTKVGKLLKGLLAEGLQTLPVVGTVVTAFKENTIENPEGAIKFYILKLKSLTISKLKYLTKNSLVCKTISLTKILIFVPYKQTKRYEKHF